MKLFVAIEGALGRATLKSLELLISNDKCVRVDSSAEADLIVVQDKKDLQRFYAEDKFFAVLSIHESEEELPENVRWIPMSGSVAGLLAFIIEIHSSQVATSGLDSMRVVSEQIERIPENKEGALHVLVVDDKSENLNLALKLLSKDHYLTLASGYAEGKKLIEKNNYDVVLCDCQMPADFDSSLSVDALEIGQTVHNGLFLMFPATQSGARFAIVTDANHHQDWVSAIFDDLREPQVINGQPVLFINYMGKKWDEALEKLMNL